MDLGRQHGQALARGAVLFERGDPGLRVETSLNTEVGVRVNARALTAEAAAAFDQLTRSERDRELVQQGPNDWANTFRTARFVPAVDYINANRHRATAMRAWARLFEGPDAVDVIVREGFTAAMNRYNGWKPPADAG